MRFSIRVELVQDIPAQREVRGWGLAASSVASTWDRDSQSFLYIYKCFIYIYIYICIYIIYICIYIYIYVCIYAHLVLAEARATLVRGSAFRV